MSTARASLALTLVPAFVKAAVRNHRAADALFVFLLVILPIVAMIALLLMIALLFLLTSTGLTGAVPLGVLDGTGMRILPS
jgi:hypothetical protein